VKLLDHYSGSFLITLTSALKLYFTKQTLRERKVMHKMNLTHVSLLDQNNGVNTVGNPRFIVDGLLVTGATSNRTLIRKSISTSLVNCLYSLFHPGSKTRKLGSYQSVIIDIERLPQISKSELKLTAKRAAVVIEKATGFTVPCKLKKYSLNFLLQYHHVDKPDVAEYIKVTTLTGNDKHKFKLVALVLEQIAIKQSLSSLIKHDEHTLSTRGSSDIISDIEFFESEL
jgi:hypothetical protein